MQINACGQSQRSKTQKMLAPNASSPCQRVSNGYLCHPLPVPSVAFRPDKKMKKNDSMKKSRNDPMKKSRKMQMPAAKASDPRPKKCWLLTLHPLSNGYLCHPLPVPNVAF